VKLYGTASDAFNSTIKKRVDDLEQEREIRKGLEDLGFSESEINERFSFVHCEREDVERFNNAFNGRIEHDDFWPVEYLRDGYSQDENFKRELIACSPFDALLIEENAHSGFHVPEYRDAAGIIYAIFEISEIIKSFLDGKGVKLGYIREKKYDLIARKLIEGRYQGYSLSRLQERIWANKDDRSLQFIYWTDNTAHAAKNRIGQIRESFVVQRALREELARIIGESVLTRVEKKVWLRKTGACANDKISPAIGDLIRTVTEKIRELNWEQPPSYISSISSSIMKIPDGKRSTIAFSNSQFSIFHEKGRDFRIDPGPDKPLNDWEAALFLWMLWSYGADHEGSRWKTLIENGTKKSWNTHYSILDNNCETIAALFSSNEEASANRVATDLIFTDGRKSKWHGNDSRPFANWFIHKLAARLFDFSAPENRTTRPSDMLIKNRWLTLEMRNILTSFNNTRKPDQSVLSWLSENQDFLNAVELYTGKAGEDRDRLLQTLFEKVFQDAP
jgi:hypothetical protein